MEWRPSSIHIIGAGREATVPHKLLLASHLGVGVAQDRRAPWGWLQLPHQNPTLHFVCIVNLPVKVADFIADRHLSWRLSAVVLIPDAGVLVGHALSRAVDALGRLHQTNVVPGGVPAKLPKDSITHYHFPTDHLLAGRSPNGVLRLVPARGGALVGDSARHISLLLPLHRRPHSIYRLPIERLFILGGDPVTTPASKRLSDLALMQVQVVWIGPQHIQRLRPRVVVQLLIGPAGQKHLIIPRALRLLQAPLRRTLSEAVLCGPRLHVLSPRKTHFPLQLVCDQLTGGRAQTASLEYRPVEAVAIRIQPSGATVDGAALWRVALEVLLLLKLQLLHAAGLHPIYHRSVLGDGARVVVFGHAARGSCATFSRQAQASPATKQNPVNYFECRFNINIFLSSLLFLS